jgi:hypothetical protein
MKNITKIAIIAGVIIAIGAGVKLLGSTGASTIVLQDDPVSVTVGAGFESEYTFRGEAKGDNVYTASVNATLYGAYIGVDGFYQAEKTKSFESEVDVYAGYTMKNLIVDWIDFDVGVKAYTYPHSNAGETDATYEVYVGLKLDELIFNPAVYAYYDVKREAATIEGTISEDLTTGNGLPLIGALTFTPSVYVGYTDINDVTPRSVNTDAAYAYAGAALDVSFEVKGVKVSVGPRYVTTDTKNATFDANELSWGALVSKRF